METLSTASQGDSSVKSEDSSPPNEGGRSSPPPNCAICLGTCKNKSFTDSCLHQFCFKCLLTWSKVKAECPLCKQNFKSIIHNVRSNHQYEQYMVEQTQEDVERIEIDNFTNATHRFRYRTTFTLPRRDSMVFQRLLHQHYPMMFPEPAQRRRPSSYFRRTVYRHNLWARPLPDFTGRFRDCSPEFYRYNSSQMHRLMPWLNRELQYLLNENAGHITYVMSQIMDLLPRYHINSAEFREAVQRYFGERSEHFLHELYCFASTPYDMAGYDRHVQYTTDSRVSTMVNEILSSSDTESSVDSDIVLVSRSLPTEAPPGPSRVPAPVYPQNFISEPAANNVIPIETLSQSDSDDDSSEVMVVGYIKPPHARTPEVVDLLGSDSDVVIEDEPQPEQPQAVEVQESRPVPLVKLTLTHHNIPLPPESESEGSTYTPPLPCTRSHQSASSSSISSSYCTTESSKSSKFQSTSSSSSTISYYSDSSSSYDPRDRSTKKKNTKKAKSTEKLKRKARTSNSKSRKSKKLKTNNSEDKKTSSNKKSNSGKGVKSSNRSNNPTAPSLSLDQPSTSGVQSSSKSIKNRKLDKKQSSRENKRLKSVVNVVNRHLRSSSSRESTRSLRSKSSSSNQSSNSTSKGGESEMVPDNNTSANLNENLSDSSDSEYNLPLNLTVKITQSYK